MNTTVFRRVPDSEFGSTADPDPRVRVLIADDHAAVRAGVCRLVDEQHDMRIVTEANSATSALSALGESPQIAAIDYHLGDRNGLWVTRRLRQLDPPPRVLIYSAFADEALALAATVAGADGLLSKSAIGDELCVAIRRLAAGRPYLPTIAPAVTRAMSACLSSSQQSLVRMLVHGVSPRLVCSRLGLTTRELETERTAILAVLSPAAIRARPPAGARRPLDYETCAADFAHAPGETRALLSVMKVWPLIFGALGALAVVHHRRQLSDLGRGLAVIVILGLVVYGSGAVHLPSVETLIRDLTATLGPYTYALVGGLAFLETGVGVGLVAPGEAAVMFGGVSAGHNEIELVPLIAIVWACALAGDLTSFFLGRRLGRGFLVSHGPKIGLSQQRLEQVERFFAAHGGKTIFIGRFVGLIRPLSPFVAGASKMPARRFIPLTALAAGIWAAAFSVLGYLFWQSLDQLIALTKQGTLALVAVIALGVGLTVLYRRLRNRSRHERSEPLRALLTPRSAATNERDAL